MSRNLMLATDSYKQSHYLQYPPEAAYISSYLEPRARDTNRNKITQFFGLMAFIKDYLETPITLEDIAEAEAVVRAHGLPFNRAGWELIVTRHKGHVPLAIAALKEGSVVPRGTPLLQVQNTDPDFAWLTTFIETALLRAIWYPSSVATKSLLMKVLWIDALTRSSDTDLAGVLPFRVHDFGARGASSSETAALGGLAHLVNFQGTDTMEALVAARKFYGADMAGYSIPASEHSTMTSWGRSRESEAYANMLDRFGGGLFSIVSDSYDIVNAVDQIFGGELKDRILAIDGCLVVRPDSGDPIDTPLMVLNLLWNHFGGHVNSKGYKVLNPKVRVIQGDGLDAEDVGNLLHAVLGAGFSAENIVVGMGSGLLQNHKRDDMRFAIKANAIAGRAGDWADVQKDPASDPTKRSRAGRQAVVIEDGEIVAIREDELEMLDVNLLQLVWMNGVLHRTESLDDVRKTADTEAHALYEKVFAAPLDVAA